jgi:adenine-specific DNA methylase
MSVEVIHEADIQAMKDEIERLKRIVKYKDLEIDNLMRMIRLIDSATNHADTLRISGDFLRRLNRGEDVI